MIPRLPMATLLASLAAHGGAAAILFFLVSGESHPSVLFVDLEAIEERGLPAATTPAGGGGETTGAVSGSSRRNASPAGLHIVSINLSSSACPPGISGSHLKIGGSASVKLHSRSGCSVAKNSAVRAP